MMKRFLTAALAVILTLSLAACGDNNSAKLPSVSTGDTSVLGTDFQKDMSQSSYTFMDFGNICETENGYYFTWYSTAYYMDKESGDCTILCGKPDCSHKSTDDGCNAQTGSILLSYYNGKLYYTSSNSVLENGSYVDYGNRLYSMNLDGTDHEVAQELDFVVGGNTSFNINIPMIHRGNIYFSYSGMLYTAALGDDVQDAVKIYGDEIVSDGSYVVDTNAMYYELWADGDTVYFMAKNVKQSNGTYKDTLFSYDPQTGKTEQVWQVPDKSEVGEWDTTGVSVNQWYVSNGYIYFFLRGNDIWYTELATGETNRLIDLKIEAGVTAFSSEYIAVIDQEYNGFYSSDGSEVDGGDTLYIYDYNGTLVNEVSLQKFYDENDKVSTCDLLWVGNGKVYILVDATTVGTINANTGVSTQTVQRHYIYTVDITSGEIQQTGFVDE